MVVATPPTPVAVKVTDGRPAEEAVRVFEPGSGPRNHPPTVAIPVASVTCRDPTTPPPPVATAKVTTTPATPSPASSRTTTVGAIGTSWPTVACWPLPAVATIAEPVGVVAVAVKTTGLFTTPPASTRAASVCSPDADPRTQLPTVTTPCASVVPTPPVTRPPPESTENVTGTPCARLPNASATRTEGAVGTAVPAGAVWAFPATALTVAGLAAVTVAVNVADTPLPAVAASVPCPAVVPSVQRVLAMPSASVIEVAGSTDPLCVVKVTVAPGSGWLSLPTTRTSIGSATSVPAGAERVALERASTREAGSGALTEVSPQPARLVSAVARARAVRRRREDLGKSWRAIWRSPIPEAESTGNRRDRAGREAAARRSVSSGGR